MGRRDRDRRPARRSPSREPRRRLLVVCEGLGTEPTYIRGYERHVRSATVQIEIPKVSGAPMTLVQLAVKLKEEAEREAKRGEDPFAAYDEVWCVFDRDEHAHFERAKDTARANGILLAISNPCFELWLLLHFRENPGAHHRHKLQSMLKDHLPGYDKRFDFALVASGIDKAIQRARRLDEDAHAMDEAGRNPTTGVYRLNESIAR